LVGERPPRHARLQVAGITVLENQAVRRDINGHPLWIAGIADAMTRYPDMRTALAPTDGVPTIVITHKPRPVRPPCRPVR